MRNGWKKGIAAGLCLGALLGLTACGGQPGTAAEDSGKVHVVATFNAMKEFVSAVGGDKVDVSVIIPDGTEPHNFAPKAQDLTSLSAAQLFVMNGLNMETWAEEAVAAIDNDKLIVVTASDGVTPIELTDEEEIAEHGRYDPHVWLSLKEAETEARNIARALAEADPSNADYYNTNCDAFVSQLENLFNEYAEKLSAAERKSIVTGHAAFAYLCRDFGLTQESVEDVFAEGEPSAKQLAELVDYCRANNVTTIFTEELVSPKVSETLASEVGANNEVIYTITGTENGGTYLERMDYNLSKILESLSE
jgi:zinc transport system substrate-binding protein